MSARSWLKIAVVVWVGGITGAGQLEACGLDWSFPTNHFDGVNSQGYVAYWEKIGELDLGPELKLPLVIGFRSEHEGSASPYLGQGWILPLLESNFVQADESHFLMLQPDGWINLFIRNGANDPVLNGSGGWKGQIRGNQIDVWAPCGWHLTYTRGHLTAMITPKNRQFEFVYSGNVVTELREGGMTRLSVEQNQSTREVSALVFNGKRLAISQEQKPQVQSISGQNVVAGMTKSLRSINGSEGPTKSFEFAVNQKVEPTLKLTSKLGVERVITWDPTTHRITRDGEWSYNIMPAADKWANAAIERKNATPQSEYWFFDGDKGAETTQDISHPRIVTTWFTSGPLAGRLRAVEQVDNQRPHRTHVAYDEAGRVVRMSEQHSTNRNIRAFEYSPAGDLLQLTAETSGEARGANTLRISVTHDGASSARKLDFETGGKTIRYVITNEGIVAR